MPDETVYANGIAEDGDYLVSPLTVSDVANLARRRLDPRQIGELRLRRRLGNPRRLADGLDPDNLAQCGWGVLFAQDDPDDPQSRKKREEILEAMKPLLDLRRQQAGERYREIVGEEGYRPKERKPDFMKRFGAAHSPFLPGRLPFYLLIVGDPASIPFRLQNQLDLPLATGRLHFDTLDEYERYALSVVAAETSLTKRPRQVVLFGPRHPNDPPTQGSSKHLLAPLEKALQGGDWKIANCFGEAASKDQLRRLLGGEETPALLFTAGHGLGYRRPHPRQYDRQGALLCQDWGGRGCPASPDHYFTGADLDGGSLQGLISFHFACYSAGTPAFDGYTPYTERDVREKSERPFVARLPQRMLAHPAGGALAVIGHVDQAWHWSFHWGRPALRSRPSSTCSGVS